MRCLSRFYPRFLLRFLNRSGVLLVFLGSSSLWKSVRSSDVQVRKTRIKGTWKHYCPDIRLTNRTIHESRLVCLRVLAIACVRYSYTQVRQLRCGHEVSKRRLWLRRNRSSAAVRRDFCLAGTTSKKNRYFHPFYVSLSIFLSLFLLVFRFASLQHCALCCFVSFFFTFFFCSNLASMWIARGTRFATSLASCVFHGFECLHPHFSPCVRGFTSTEGARCWRWFWNDGYLRHN